MSRMDAATEPPWTDLRRPPQPDPPRNPTGSPLLLLPLLRRVQGAALPSNTPSCTMGLTPPGHRP
ncbi:protein of unknown function [Stenotrophomonas maltophilia]|nr:protein of unknown function [Stenotrophomonas maltophilia]